MLRPVRCALLLVLALALPAPSVASAADGRWLDTVVLGDRGYSIHPNMDARAVAVDGQGGVHAAWLQMHHQGTAQINTVWSAYRTPGGDWQTAIVEQREGWDAGDTPTAFPQGDVKDLELEVTPSGQAVLGYVATSPGEQRVVVHRRTGGAPWVAQPPLPATERTIPAFDLGVADDGTATLAWLDGNPIRLNTVRGTPGAWEAVQNGYVQQGGNGGDWVKPTVDVSPAGESVVMVRDGYYDWRVFRRGPADLAFDGGTTIGTALLKDHKNVDCFKWIDNPDVEIAPDGRVAAAWTDNCSSDLLPVRVAVRTSGGAWLPPADLATNGTYQTVTDLTRSGNDIVAAFFTTASNGAEAVRVAELPAGATAFEEPVTAFGIDGGDPDSFDGRVSVALGADGTLAVAAAHEDYYEAIEDKAMVRVRRGGTWSLGRFVGKSTYYKHPPEVAVDGSGNVLALTPWHAEPKVSLSNDSAEHEITVNAAPPSIEVDVPATAMTGEAVAMTATTSGAGAYGDPSKAKVTWDFGDGSAPVERAPGQGVVHTFSHAQDEPRQHTVTATIDDGVGGTATDSATITVARAPNRAPTASFTATPTQALADTDITLDASASTDPDGGTITGYSWDLEADGTEDETSSAPVTTVQFATGGAHKIRLTVTDDRGGTATAEGCVEVVTLDGKGPGDGKTPGCDGKVTGGGGGGGGGGDGGDGGGGSTPPSGGGTPQVPASGELVRSIEIGPIQAFAVAGFKQEGMTWVAYGAARVNGIDFVPSGPGAKVVFDPINATVAARGDVNVSLNVPRVGGFTLYRGAFSWSFAGGKINLPVPAAALPFAVPKAKAAQLPHQADRWEGHVHTNGILLPKIKLPHLPETPELTLPTGGMASLMGFGFYGGVKVRLAGGGAAIDAVLEMPKLFGGAFGQSLSKATLRATMAGGLQLDSLLVKVDRSWIGPMEVAGIEVAYDGARERWQGHGQVYLPSGPVPPHLRKSIGGGFAFEKGAFVEGRVLAERLDLPLGWDFKLQRVEFLIETQPHLHLNGKIGIEGGPYIPALKAAAAQINGEFDAKLADPWVFVVKGDASIAGQPLADAYVEYRTNGKLLFDGSLKFGVKDFKAEAELDGWVDGPNGTFSAEGAARLVVFSYTGGGRFVLSSVGMGGCLQGLPRVQLLGQTWGGEIGFGMTWGGLPEVRGCDLAKFAAERPADMPKRKKAAAAQDAGSEQGVTVERGLPAKAFRFTGRGGAPRVTLTGPDGTTVTAPADGSPLRTDRALVLTDREQGITYVILRKPAAGVWGVTTPAGTPALAGVSGAAGLPEPNVRATVSGRGHRRTLSWNLTPLPGQQVTFFERGPDGMTKLATTKAAKGRQRFRPAEGRGGRRDIVAAVQQDGAPRDELVAGRYTAPADRAPAPPARVTARRAGAGLQASWPEVDGAQRYAVRVLAGDTLVHDDLVTTPRLRLARVPAGERLSVQVSALDARNRAGRARVVKVAETPGVSSRVGLVKGAVPIVVSCPAVQAERCRGSLRLTAPRGKAGRAGRKAFSVAPGQSALVRVRVARPVARKVTRKGLRLTAEAVLSGGDVLARGPVVVRR